ncbi:hypothetical protein ACWA7J_21730 [Leptothrix sp. BB-4]
MKFKFKLCDPVILKLSGEAGSVRARTEYVTRENAYLVRYLSADGRAVEAWWDESALLPGQHSTSAPPWD